MVSKVNLVTITSVTKVTITIATLVPFGSRDSVVGIMTRYGLDVLGIESWCG
jgi:hypothetical protein